MEHVRIQVLDGADPLNAGIVDQNVHLLDAAKAVGSLRSSCHALRGFQRPPPAPRPDRDQRSAPRPCPASRRAIAAPIPLAPPVINAERPCSPDESSMTDILRSAPLQALAGGAGQTRGPPPGTWHRPPRRPASVPGWPTRGSPVQVQNQRASRSESVMLAQASSMDPGRTRSSTRSRPIAVGITQPVGVGVMRSPFVIVVARRAVRGGYGVLRSPAHRADLANHQTRKRNCWSG